MRALAYVVGPDEGPGAALRDLARQVGFDTVLFYRSLAAAEQQSLTMPLLYFLFAAEPNLRKIKPIADAIRLSPVQRVRFSPMIYFSETPSLQTIRSCIDMGFDDVITLPFTIARVEDRLERQVERPLVYYQTATYFGPDRRGRTEEEERHSGRGTGGQYRRFEIFRIPRSGIRVLSDEVHVEL